MSSDARNADEALYERLWCADRDGLVEIGIDLRHFNQAGSPTHSAKDNGLPFVATLCCSATAWMLGGWIWGLAILASGIILTFTSLNVWLMHRLRERTLTLARSGVDGWLEAWNFGGISLRLTDTPDIEIESPNDDWRTFVAKRLPLPDH